MPTLLSLQVATARRVQINGRAILTAIHKQPVTGSVAVRPLGLMGDYQADLSVHGGLDKAVYAYPSEHYPFWQAAQELNVGVGVQYKYNKYTYDRGILVSELGGELGYEGLQVFATFRF